MRRIEALFNQRNLEEIEDAVNTLSLCLVGKNENLNIKNRILRKDFISTSITPINFKKHSSSIINVINNDFFPEEYKKTLGVLGSKSGRDMDKMHDSGLTAKVLENSVTFEEAELTLVCKKLFKQTLSKDNIVESETSARAFYNTDAEHDMYIGEVVDIIR